MGGKGTHRQCVICGTRERHKGDRSLFFANFPTDKARCKEWVRLIGDEDLVHIPILKLQQLRHICGDHFERRDLNKKGNRTRRRAVPKLNLTAPPLTEDLMIGFPFSMASSLPQAENNPPVQHSSGSGKRKPEDGTALTARKKILVDVSNIQTDLVTEAVASTSTSGQTQNIQYGCTTPTRQTQENKDNPQMKPKEESLELTPKMKKLMQELRKTKCTLRALKKSAKLIEDLDSEVLKSFVMSAFKNQKRKPRGRRWTPKNKISALAIYKRSPMTYRYMAHTMPLPSVKTLQNLLKKVPMETGINQSVLAQLTKKSEKAKKKDKFYCLLFDEMALN